MREIVAQLPAMIWIAFAIMCLIVIQKYLGGSLSKFIRTLGEEFISLRKGFGERGAINMAGGLSLIVVIFAFYIFDSVGKVAKVGAGSSVSAEVAKVVVLVASLVLLGTFFLLCVRFVSPPNRKP